MRRYRPNRLGLTELLGTARLALGKKYLDWAEMLPNFNGGWIADLQGIREHQRKESEETFKGSRPPENLGFRYSLCMQVELFPLEEFGALDAAISALFPDPWFGRGRLESIREVARSLFGSGTYNVGILIPKGRRLLGGLPAAALDGFPADVEHIYVQVVKVLPSTFVTCFCAVLKDDVTSRIRAHLDRRYLPATRFRRWVPFGRFGYSYSQTPAALAMQGAVLSELAQLRMSLEDVIGRHFRGYFLKQGDGTAPRLPAIELFDLHGVPSEGDNAKESLHQVYAWGEALQLDRATFEFDGYRTDKSMFVLGREGRSGLPVAHRFVMFGDIAEQESQRHQRLYLLSNNSLSTLAQFMALLEFLSQVRRTVESLRLRIYRRFATSSFLMRFRKDIRLHRQLQKESLLLSRFALEFEQSEQQLKRGSSHLKSFRSVYEKRKERDLESALFEWIDYQLHTLSKHVDLVSKVFMDHISMRNMDLAYRLQRQMFVWTVVVTIATTLGLIATWPTLKVALQRLLGLLGA